MWLTFYNNKGIGDVLLLTQGSIPDDQIQTETQGEVTAIIDSRTQVIKGYNIFNISNHIDLDGSGEVQLTQEQENIVNEIISSAGFKDGVEIDRNPKFVVGKVVECKPHEDSDHLQVTQIEVSKDEPVQIVCGAANMKKGLTVVVALPGAVMPSGMIIWQGELRGVQSNGMVCSTRELDLQDIEDLPGIWELSEHFEAGTPLAEVINDYRKKVS